MANPLVSGMDQANRQAGSIRDDFSYEPVPPASTPRSSVPPGSVHGTPPPTPQPTPPSKSARRVSWFWPGFAVGFFLLALLSLGGLALFAGVSPLRLTELQTQGNSWTPPPIPPTPEVVEQPTVVAQPGGQETPLGFQVGDTMRNMTQSRVNIRQMPGYLSKPEGDVVAQIGPGETVELLGGRATADNLNWWYIRYRTPGNQVIDGWIADATASGVQILGR